MYFWENVRRQNATKRVQEQPVTANELGLSFEYSISGCLSALHDHDLQTWTHSLRVSALSMMLAEEMGLSQREVIMIGYGAALHDIGKLYIPLNILRKRTGLTRKEYHLLQKHTVLGYEMLGAMHQIQPVSGILLHHHERWDGMGYPFGLKGKMIPLVARITAVADVWDAMLYRRPYHQGRSTDEVYETIVRHAGISFDPEVISAFQSTAKRKELVFHQVRKSAE